MNWISSTVEATYTYRINKIDLLDSTKTVHPCIWWGTAVSPGDLKTSSKTDKKTLVQGSHLEQRIFASTKWFCLNQVQNLLFMVISFVCMGFILPLRITHMETSPLPCHTYCDTGHPFIMVISVDLWHSHLLPSV